MKAPNKIYRHQGELRTSFASDTKLDDEDICYIRKDFLLELIEKESGLWDEGGIIFSRLINELNEL